MWDGPLPANTRAHPYRGLSVQEVDGPLTDDAILTYLDGREVYRRTDFLALRHGDATALVQVRKASLEPLFSPVVAARVVSGPDDTAWVVRPEVDVGNATALANAAVPGAATTLVLGRFEHVNFIYQATPIPVRVTEVVPPHPPKLLAQARQAVEFDEDLPPVELVLDAVMRRPGARGVGQEQRAPDVASRDAEMSLRLEAEGLLVARKAAGRVIGV